MLEIVKVSEQVKDAIEKKASEYQVQIDDKIFYDKNYYCLTLKEKTSIYGFGCIAIDGIKGYLKQLDIFLPNGNDKDVYSDFLFRGLVNASELRGLSFLYIDADMLLDAEMLQKIGRNLTFDINDKGEAVLDIHAFFSTQCNCKA